MKDTMCTKCGYGIDNNNFVEMDLTQRAYTTDSGYPIHQTLHFDIKLCMDCYKDICYQCGLEA